MRTDTGQRVPLRYRVLVGRGVGMNLSCMAAGEGTGKGSVHAQRHKEEIARYREAGSETHPSISKTLPAGGWGQRYTHFEQRVLVAEFVGEAGGSRRIPWPSISAPERFWVIAIHRN